MKRSVMGLIYLIQGLESAGVNIQHKCEQIGIIPSALDPNTLIDRDLEWKIVNALTQECDPELGLHVAQQYSLSGYGPYFMLLLTAPNVREALQCAIEFQQLTYLFGQLETVVREQQLWLYYLDVENEKNLLRSHAEIAGTYKFIKDIYKLIGLENIHIEVRLSQDLPTDETILSKYQKIYGSDIKFGQPSNIFICDQDILNQTLSTADHVMHEVYRSKCLEEITRLSISEDAHHVLVHQILNYLNLQNGVMPKLKDISIALNIPERTLRHQLNQSNTSFQKVKEDYLKNKAIKLLAQKNTIENIALALGYSETSAFNHAFKKWYGISPNQYLNKKL